MLHEFWSRADRVDQRLMLRLAGTPAHRSARALRVLSRTADHSKLWVAVAALMAATRRPQAQRAALRGLLSLSVSSAIVNLPAKRLARRTRPPLADLDPRRLLTQPKSWSFPSGHTASAAAFATGASLEDPRLAVPLGLAAAAVGASRVSVGSHYPSDVAAGAVCGAAVALGVSRFWRVAPRTPGELHRALQRAPAQPSSNGAGLVIAINDGAGDAQSSTMRDLLTRGLPEARLVDPGDGDLDTTLRHSVDGARMVGVAGGDGTANVGAAVALDAGLPLLVVPAGTLNHLARDLGLESPEQAIDAVRAGDLGRADVGRIAGFSFLNTASIGSYAQLVAAREQLEDRIGKWPAMAVALLRVLRDVDPVELELDGQRRRLWLAFFGNCSYGPRGFGPSSRARLDDRVIDVRLLDAAPRWSRTRLVFAALTGRLGRCRAYEQWTATRVDVRSLQGALPLARDGEVFDGPDVFAVEKDDRQLPVVAHGDVLDADPTRA